LILLLQFHPTKTQHKPTIFLSPPGIGLADKATEWKDKYGPVFTMYLGSKPTVVISSIEALTEAYMTRGDDFANKSHSVSLDAVTENGKNIAFADLSEGLKFRRKNVMQVWPAAFTDSHITHTLSDVFFAGVDTTRHTLAWIFLYLALNPDVQRKVQAEIDDIVGDAVPGREHRPGLVSRNNDVVHSGCYTRSSGIEHTPTLQLLLPPTKYTFQLMGYDIPAKTEIMVNQYAILRDPNHWDQPESFVPGRYLDKDGGKLTLKPKSWIPFSIGQRSCV
ncbi:steroid 17-alpha-hydroxylase/17,20 lyase-like, partial [Aplysia californica]|uniref:Steroid 17-alpha-hydroxylase/17,20 lyase-like n=1 Tax=Aplysia californica TaxID=6500 RepID=A0ABM1W487_APLCA